MKCMQCGKEIKNKDKCRLDKDGGVIDTPFCSYDCYKNYWSEISFFKPLKHHKDIS